MNIKMVKVSELKFGPIKHEKLPDGFIVRVQKYKERLREVEITSLEETISNFQRDLHPENELSIWEAVADRYEIEEKNNPKWTVKEKRDCLGKLLFSTTG